MARDYYRLPDGRVISTDASATKHANTIDYTLADGSIVTAVRSTSERQRMALDMSACVRGYLADKYGHGRDLSWHPLFVAARSLFCDLMEGE